MLGPALLGVAAAVIGTWPNDGAWAHQGVATSAIAVALLATIRVVGPGTGNPGARSVGVGLAIASGVVALGALWFMSADLPVWFLAAILVGIAPAMLKAALGLTIRVPSGMLLDNDSVIREARPSATGSGSRRIPTSALSSTRRGLGSGSGCA